MISMEKTKIESTATIHTTDGKVITKKVVENTPSIDEYDPSDLDKFMSTFAEYERQTVKARNAIGKEITQVWFDEQAKKGGLILKM